MNRLLIERGGGALLLCAALLASCALYAASLNASPAAGETGLAAVYSDRLNGHRTASGAKYDRNKLTAAHKTLPFGTEVKVTNTKNGKSIVVRITDRGPKQPDRVLDLSPRAARALGIGQHAMAPVTLEVQS